MSMVTERKHLQRIPLAGFVALVLLLLPLLPGCGLISSSGLTGYVFTYTRVPYTKDLNNTPVVLTKSDGAIIKIQEPFSGVGMYAEFNTNAIGDLAKRYNMKTLYYAELEIFDVLGIWQQKRLYLYGE